MGQRARASAIALWTRPWLGPPTSERRSTAASGFERERELRTGQRRMRGDQYVRRKRADLQAAFLRFAHERADDVVRFAEWQAALDQKNPLDPVAQR